MIYVTKTYLPVRKSFEKYVDKIYSSHRLTNFGPLEQELTEKLCRFLNVDNILLTSNGTLAMQVAYKALEINGEVITSPFSFVATTSSLIWEHLQPIFADIDPLSLNIDPAQIEIKISKNTSAILPVHVFGRACDVWKIQRLADKHNLKIIYDAAHAFNITTNEEQSILNYGDASTLSFHATKIFHTIEGGAIISKNKDLIKQCKNLINFGIIGHDRIAGLGINCKMNEFSAAMGLAVFENINDIFEQRAYVSLNYNQLLNPSILLHPIEYANSNYSYYPILLKDEDCLLKLRAALLSNDVFTRRYFYPSLNTLDYIEYQPCPISEDISKRILCLPMYESLKKTDIKKICKIVNQYAT